LDRPGVKSSTPVDGGVPDRPGADLQPPHLAQQTLLHALAPRTRTRPAQFECTGANFADGRSTGSVLCSFVWTGRTVSSRPPLGTTKPLRSLVPRALKSGTRTSRRRTRMPHEYVYFQIYRCKQCGEPRDVHLEVREPRTSGVGYQCCGTAVGSVVRF